MLQNLETETDLQAWRQEHPLFVAYFSTPLCGVCQTLRPKVEHLLDELALPGAYVNTNALPKTAGQLIVFAVPTIVVFAEGHEVKRFSRHFPMRDLRDNLTRTQHLMAG
ncbi:MAG: thioredoxin family protein [Deltaproteobacteria bacterium]|nr:thioredoxin family protein [Deltaproteobacteria bacterium]